MVKSERARYGRSACWKWLVIGYQFAIKSRIININQAWWLNISAMGNRR